MNSPGPIFLDSGILIGLCNKQEQALADRTLDFLASQLRFPRLFVDPCLVEFFYKMKKLKVMSPRDMKKNFDMLSAVSFPVDHATSQKILNTYFDLNFKNEFDYADYFLCCSALQFPKSRILTIDRDDLPLALSAAYRSGLYSQDNLIQLLPLDKV